MALNDQELRMMYASLKVGQEDGYQGFYKHLARTPNSDRYLSLYILSLAIGSTRTWYGMGYVAGWLAAHQEKEGGRTPVPLAGKLVPLIVSSDSCKN